MGTIDIRAQDAVSYKSFSWWRVLTVFENLLYHDLKKVFLFFCSFHRIFASATGSTSYLDDWVYYVLYWDPWSKHSYIIRYLLLKYRLIFYESLNYLTSL